MERVSQYQLTDLEKAGELADELQVAPDGEAALRQFVAELNAAAVEAAGDDDLPHGLRFTVCPVIQYPEGHVEAVEAWLQSESDDPGPEPGLDEPGTLIGFKVLVTPMSRGRAERLHRYGSPFRAKRNATVRRQEAEGRARRPRGPRRRGAGRPGHRSRQRANAPPSDDDGEPEPHPVARPARRASCCLGRRR